MTRKAEQTRERILTAAEDVVLSDGVARLTLEAAAARAGVSKGGVLYHFPSRAALVSAMVRRVAHGFDAGVRRHRSHDTGSGSFTRAYVHESFADATDPDIERGEQLGAVVLAAMACEPELMAPLREAFDGWQGELEHDGVDPVRATIARLACDGLWLSDLFGLAPLDSRTRREVHDELIRMTT